MYKVSKLHIYHCYNPTKRYVLNLEANDTHFSLNSTGLFAILSAFFQDDEPPEITYCVVENTGTLSLQALTPTQPMPPQDELDAKFAELVVSETNEPR